MRAPSPPFAVRAVLAARHTAPLPPLWGQKPRKACVIPARSLLSPRMRRRNPRRVRRRTSGRSFAYNIRFAGQIFDGQAGLHANGFRDFDPATGRYVESDPIGIRGGVNTYLYSNA